MTASLRAAKLVREDGDLRVGDIAQCRQDLDRIVAVGQIRRLFKGGTHKLGGLRRPGAVFDEGDATAASGVPKRPKASAENSSFSLSS